MPSTHERREVDTSVGAISQGDMLIAAKQKRLMSAQAARPRKVAETEQRLNEYNLYM